MKRKLLHIWLNLALTAIAYFLAAGCSPKIPVAEYQPIIRANPDEAGIQYNRGLSLCLLGKNEAAAEAFKGSIEKNPEDADAWFRLGKVYQVLSRMQDAQNAYSRAFAAGAFTAQHQERGDAYLLLSDYENAENEYKLAFKADEPHPTNTLCKLGQACIFQEKNELAVQYYAQALKMDSKSASQYNAYFFLGAAYQKLGNHESALENYDRGLEYNPKDQNIHWNKAVIYYKEGDIGKVREEVAILEEINPEMAAVLNKQFGWKPASN